MAEKTIPSTNREDNLVRREVTRNPDSYVTPLTDIYETEESLNVVVDLPGVEKEGLKISVEKGILTIEGKVKSSIEKNYLFREYEASNFFRQFELTDSIDQENIEAELKNGILQLNLPKAEEQKPRNIEVKFN
jgi:HSP20 family molecular chaperone IbpA